MQRQQQKSMCCEQYGLFLQQDQREQRTLLSLTLVQRRLPLAVSISFVQQSPNLKHDTVIKRYSVITGYNKEVLSCINVNHISLIK